MYLNIIATVIGGLIVGGFDQGRRWMGRVDRRLNNIEMYLGINGRDH